MVNRNKPSLIAVLPPIHIHIDSWITFFTSFNFNENDTRFSIISCTYIFDYGISKTVIPVFKNGLNGQRIYRQVTKILLSQIFWQDLSVTYPRMIQNHQQDTAVRYYSLDIIQIHAQNWKPNLFKVGQFGHSA